MIDMTLALDALDDEWKRQATEEEQ